MTGMGQHGLNRQQDGNDSNVACVTKQRLNKRTHHATFRRTRVRIAVATANPTSK